MLTKHSSRKLTRVVWAATFAVVLLIAGTAVADERRSGDPTSVFAADPSSYRDVATTSGATEAVGQEDVVLSNETTLSRWAFVLRRTVARAAPVDDAKRIGKLGTLTPDGTAELVLLLRRTTDAEGKVWVEVRLPMRPNNTTGWVPRHHLGRYRTVRNRLLIDTKRFRATLYKSGKRIWSARVAVGTRKNPTPKGKFYVRNRLIPVEKNGIYGIFAFGLSAYSDTLSDWPGGGMVGIHGTNRPELIPGRVSHGCIRLKNRNIKRLKRLMTVGTPVEIR